MAKRTRSMLALVALFMGSKCPTVSFAVQLVQVLSDVNLSPS
jgi:hypothetical protein